MPRLGALAVAPRKKRDADADAKTDPLDKIAGLLAVHVTRDMEKDVAARFLEGLGFTDPEINGALGTSEGYMRQLRFQQRKARKKRK
jgi:hypothetical protein